MIHLSRVHLWLRHKLTDMSENVGEACMSSTRIFDEQYVIDIIHTHTTQIDTQPKT